jgi:hypothetical protein
MAADYVFFCGLEVLVDSVHRRIRGPDPYPDPTRKNSLGFDHIRLRIIVTSYLFLYRLFVYLISFFFDAFGVVHENLKDAFGVVHENFKRRFE